MMTGIVIWGELNLNSLNNQLNYSHLDCAIYTSPLLCAGTMGLGHEA